MKKPTSQGFTLIELMVVAVAISLLASVAWPAYQGYAVRSRVMDGMALAGAARAAVARNMALGRRLDHGWVAPVSTPDVSGISINTANGVITIIYGEAIDGGGKQLQLVPVLEGRALPAKAITQTIPLEGLIEWSCTGPAERAGGLNQKYRPAACRG